MPKLAKRLPTRHPAVQRNNRRTAYGGATVVPFSGEQVNLVWEVQPDRGATSWDIDFRIFETGSVEAGLTPRPRLIRELAGTLRLESRGRKPQWGVNTKAHMKRFWSFLDVLKQRGAGDVQSVIDIDRNIGQIFKSWLLQETDVGLERAREYLGKMRHLNASARHQLDIENWDLLWPTIQHARGMTQHKDIEPIILKPLYSVLKDHHMRCEAAFEEGAYLLANGADPRASGNGRLPAAWSKPANVATLIHEFVINALKDHSLYLGNFSHRLQQPKNYGLPVLCPTPFATAMSTPFDSTRWFVPMLEDTLCAFMLVLLHTGWNQDTVFNVDISCDDAWCDLRLGAGDQSGKSTVAIYGHKSKTAKEQIAFSLVRPHSHPYQVIRSITRRTALLRRSLQERLEKLATLGSSTSNDTREVQTLRYMISSPWLYFAKNPKGYGGKVGILTPDAGFFDNFRRFCQKAITHANQIHSDFGKNGKYEALSNLTPSDLRDGFAAYLYERSMYNVLLVKRALGHGSLRTTRAYLRQRRQIAERFAEYTRLQEHLFDEIRDFRFVDTTALFIRARLGGITDAQRRRLADHRSRTRMGMGCLDPTNPPQEIAPGHRGGFCAVQRCTLCQHGVVFESSLPELAMRMAELRFIRSRAAQARFQDSSFQLELVVIEALAQNVFSGRKKEFDAMADAHFVKLKTDNAYLFDQVPPTFFNR